MDFLLFQEYLQSYTYKGKRLEKYTIDQIVSRTRLLLSYSDPISEKFYKSFIQEKLHSQEFGEATANKYNQTVRHYGRFLDLRWTDSLIKYRADTPPPNRFSEEELKKFLSVPKRPLQSEENYKKWTLYWHLSFFLGFRPVEIRRITVNQIDIGNKIILLQKTKTSPRTACMISQLIGMIEDRMRIIEGNYLFPCPSNPEIPMGSLAHKKDFEHRMKEIGIRRHLRPYDTRHTAITRWAKIFKLSVFEIKQLAGHKKIETTEKYVALTQIDDLRKSIEQDPYFITQLNAQEKFDKYAEEIYKMKIDKSICFVEATNNSITISLKEFI